MKKRAILLWVMALTLNFGSFAQLKKTNDFKIDPRQYVLVEYKKDRNTPLYDTIWNWEERNRVNEQKQGFLNVDGVLRISFNRIGFIDNKEFEGTVSLAAEIVGSGGKRNIEVSPYSEVGEARSAVGIKSAPPIEITRKLLNMMIALKDVSDLYEFNSIYGSFTKDDFVRKSRIDLISKQIDSLSKLANTTKATMLNLVKKLRDEVHPEFSKLYYDDPSGARLRIDNRIAAASDVSEYNDVAQSLYSEYLGWYEADRENYINRFISTIKVANDKIPLALTYLNSFEKSGEDAMRALLRLINKDMIIYNSLKEKLVRSNEELGKISFKSFKGDELAKILLDNADKINDALRDLSAFARFEGSRLEKEVELISNNKSIRDYYKEKNFSDSAINEKSKNDFSYAVLLDSIETIADKISTYAGEIIFQNLISATIDLNASGAKTGERLNIKLVWTKNNFMDTIAKPYDLEIGSYLLEQTGWQFDITDMFALIKRRHESRVDPATVSPSNFKGSGGAVLMWTYYKESHGLKIEQEGAANMYIAKLRNKFMNFFQPSIGLNISYVDFSTSKDVEIGTGIQLGLFRNKIFAGYGVNLHMLSPKDQSPTYFFIGFSFAKLGDLFKDHGSIASQK